MLALSYHPQDTQRSGQISLCIIHAASKDLKNPGMRRVGMHVKRYSTQRPHILKDTDHLLSMIRQVKMPQIAKLVKFDINRFFMSGENRLFADLVSDCFLSDIQLEACCLIDCIHEQSRRARAKLHQCLVRQSGNWHGVEMLPWAFRHLQTLRREFRGRGRDAETLRVLLYCLFKDDGFFVIDSTCEQWDQLCQELKRREDCYRFRQCFRSGCCYVGHPFVQRLGIVQDRCS